MSRPPESVPVRAHANTPRSSQLPLPLAGEGGGEGQPKVEVRRPPLWDGQAAARIVARLADDLLR